MAKPEEPVRNPGSGLVGVSEELKRVCCFIIRGVDGVCRPPPLLDAQLNRTLPGTAGRGTTSGTSPTGSLYASLTLFLRRGAV